MSRTVVIKGRMVGPSTVELDEPLPERTQHVAVIARVGEKPADGLSSYLRALPQGARTK